MKEIKKDEVLLFRKRFYRVEMSPYSYGKAKTGKRVILKLLSEQELNNLIIKNLKGGKS